MFDIANIHTSVEIDSKHRKSYEEEKKYISELKIN